MMKYIKSVFGGISGAILIVVLLPILAFVVIVAGFLGQINISKEKSNESSND